ncbi:MAG: hypothetical protein O3A01_01910 [bacterium]|nr:hypothetical protein [bacterium]
MNNMLNDRRPFTEYLEERGLFIDNKGGIQPENIEVSKVSNILPGSYMVSIGDATVTCFNSEVFIRTIRDVESKLKYQLFGNQ